MNAPVSMQNVPEKLRLRVADFLLLNERGAFAAYGKTELIDGDIFYMNAQHSDHARIKSRLHLRIGNRLAAMGSDLEALVEVTVSVADDAAPEPDIVLTRWRGAGVVPADTVALVVEVSDTTLSRDLGRKAELYAAAGIPEYWVVDVEGRRVVLHSRPAADGYDERAEVPFGEPLAAREIEGLELGVVRLVD